MEDVDCVAEFAVSRESDWISVECNVRGKVKVICDRCLEDLFLPVAAQEKLTVRFDADWENVVNDDDNVIILPEGVSEVDLGQAVYDFICLS
ncbi:MAG: DUF177 domain-containing protein, partial [Bacteroidales bacterium]|nr:DUF177 domain-containing protein [Bacteroidales bacterium]